MHKRLIILLTAVILGVLVAPVSMAAAPVAGKACGKLGQTQLYKSKNYTCIKSGNKFLWSKPVAVAPLAPIPSPTPTLTPTPAPVGGLVVTAPKAYPNPVGALTTSTSDPTTSFELPVDVQAPPSGTNVKLWVYDPVNHKIKAGSQGVFIGLTGGSWTFYPINSDGSFYANLSAGTYGLDIVEPNTVQYLRKRYTATVSPSRTFSISGLTANSKGYFTVTVDLIKMANPMLEDLKQKITSLASIQASSFRPNSACQLIDQVTPYRGLNVDLSAGFPKVAQRLTSAGRIKALIVPIDFSDVKGKDNTVAYFSPIATNVRDFYFKQSYGAVAFDFDIVSSWVRAPFTSTKFGGGTVGSGDPNGYLNAIISLSDGAIDYSGYDAVYYLVPKEMPMANMGWGPAITYPHWTSNGVIINGATGGADMYFTENTGIVGGTWKWMAHETGHAFGLYDEDLNHASQTLGYWGIMAMSWSNRAIELGAWDRYLQGWLPQSQVNCTEMSSITSAGTTTKISPIVRQDKEVKTIMVPLTSSKILVIESRKSESLDNIPAIREGVLIYTVDMTKGQLGGGYVIQKRIGSTDGNFEDAALRSGDSITVEGVKITVMALDSSGDTVKISKP